MCIRDRNPGFLLIITGWGELGKVIVQFSTTVFSGAVENFSGNDGLAPLEKIGPYVYCRHHWQWHIHFWKMSLNPSIIRRVYRGSGFNTKHANWWTKFCVEVVWRKLQLRRKYDSTAYWRWCCDVWRYLGPVSHCHVGHSGLRHRSCITVHCTSSATNLQRPGKSHPP